MFMTDLLLPGPFAPLAGLACAGAVVGGIVAFRKKIPHPSECDIIGSCCLFCKCHQHKKFDLVISVHEAENMPKGSKTYLYVRSGRFEVQTQDCRVDDKTQQADFHERLKIHVRQMDDVVKVSIYKKLTLSSEVVGTVELDVVKDLIGDDFPTNKWYTMQKDDKNTCKIRLSFTKLEGGAEGMSPLLMQAMIQAQMEATAKGETPPTLDFVNMEPKERLNLLAKALEGPLQMMKGIGMKSWTPVYFKMVEVKANDWEWQYWPDKKACQHQKPKAGKIRMMGISNILPDPASRHGFYIKYHDSQGSHDYMFQRVERDRDIWSDGLYEFLDRLRDYLSKYRPQKNKAHAFVEDKKKKKLGVRRPSFAIDPSARRVGAAIGGDNEPRPPKALAAMAGEMVEDEDEPVARTPPPEKKDSDEDSSASSFSPDSSDSEKVERVQGGTGSS